MRGFFFTRFSFAFHACMDFVWIFFHAFFIWVFIRVSLFFHTVFHAGVDFIFHAVSHTVFHAVDFVFHMDFHACANWHSRFSSHRFLRCCPFAAPYIPQVLVAGSWPW